MQFLSFSRQLIEVYEEAHKIPIKYSYSDSSTSKVRFYSVRIVQFF
jgi:hypothetical protein